MSAKRRKLVSARNVAARTHGEAMSALVAVTFSTSEIMTLASVSFHELSSLRVLRIHYK